MKMEFFKMTFLILIIKAGCYSPCMACGGRVKYTAQRHSIQSPNFYQEYGKEANCTWEFNDINRNYGLVLTLSTMRMYYYDVSSDKQCGDSYRLTINGKSVNCMLDINNHNAPHYSFYTNPSCTTVECPIRCDDWTEISSTSINVEYFADGSKPNPNAMDDEMWGFKMQYQYVNCPTAPIATPTTTSMSPTIAASPTTTVLMTTTTSQPTTTSAPNTALTTCPTGVPTTTSTSAPATSTVAATSTMKATTTTNALTQFSNEAVESETSAWSTIKDTTAVGSGCKMNATSAMIGAGTTAVVIVLTFVVIRLTRYLMKKKRRESLKQLQQSDDVIPMEQTQERVEYANVAGPASPTVYCEVTTSSQGQSSDVAISINPTKSADKDDDLVLTEMPGYQAVEFKGGFSVIHDA